MAAAENDYTNPLDFPRYVRSLRPSLPDSLPYYLDEELDKVSTSLRSLEEAVSNEAAARIEEERIIRVTDDEALAARIVNVTAEFNTSLTAANARITDEEIARATADEDLVSRIVTVEADFEAANSATNARITSEQLARATAEEALAAKIDTVQASFSDAITSTNARFSSEQAARANADSALASSVSSLTTTVNGHTASISTQQSSIDGMLLKYGVTLDSNGYVTGFQQNNNGSSGEFIVKADRFKIVMPGAGAITPFQVSSGLVKINGNLVVDGTITATQIADQAVNTGKMGAGSVTVPYTYDGSAWIYCPTETETTVLEMPSPITVGDATDGGAVIMFFAEIDSSSNKDTGLMLRLYTSINGGGYTFAGTTKGGIRTGGANSFFDMPVSLMHSVEAAQTVRVKVTAIPYIVDTASDTRPAYVREPKVAILGAMR